jgi:elongation factor G
VTDIEITLIDGSSHAVDSSALAYRVAAGMAFRSGLHEGQSVLLEPVVRAEVLTSEEQLGDVLGRLAGRRADIEGIDRRPGGIEAVHAMVPLREMFGYATELRSTTHGRGSFTMEFDHFAQVPEEVMEAYRR